MAYILKDDDDTFLYIYCDNITTLFQLHVFYCVEWETVNEELGNRM